MSYKTLSYDTGPVFIYGLVDPFTDSIFYVGISINPWARIKGHRYDPASSAWQYIREVRAAGFDVDLCVLEKHPTRTSAELRERVYLAALPGLVNQERRPPHVSA